MSETETPGSALDAGQTLMSSEAPADNAAVGGTEMSCPDVIVNIGVFFDGTFNNAFNTANNGEGVDEDYTTNVYRLFQRYKTPSDDTRHETCGTLKEVYRGRYVTGIGTETNQGNDTYGGGTGHGAQGLATKASEAARWYASQINGFGGLDNITEVNVDIFGFSRGAATARFFANIVRDLDPKVKVRFLGVYDTVGSFGVPGNDREMTTQGELIEMYCELPLMLQGGAGILFCAVTPEQERFDLMVHANSAEAVFHVIADDEFRSMFPVTRVTPGHGTEIYVPGCHGDAAGAAPAGDVTEIHTNPPQWLIDRGFFAQGSYEFVDRIFPIPNQHVYRRTVSAGIGPVTLSAMVIQGINASVPFNVQPISIPSDPDIRDLHRAAVAGRSLSVTRRREIAARYAHSSHDFGLSGIANWAESGGIRGSYPNQP